MYAKNLELILYNLLDESDVSKATSVEYVERFNSLRGYGKLPRGRENREVLLTNKHIAATILGLAALNPGWAGHGAIVLGGLCPVGGRSASFFFAETLEVAIECALHDQDARDALIRISLTLGEFGMNNHGFASIQFEADGETRTAHFVSKLAFSLQQPGAEATFDPEAFAGHARREISFSKRFFSRLVGEIERFKAFPPRVAGDGSEYNEDDARKARQKRLEATPQSRFLNVGVENQVTWPKEETLVRFDRYKFVLLPRTREHVQSVHVDLTANRLDDRGARTAINRLLSVMSWCSDNFAVAGFGWSGNPLPVPVEKQDLAFTTAYDWIFDRRIPPTEEGRRALALYREALNAKSHGLISYAVLNFYKIIEIRNHGRGSTKNWFRDNFSVVELDKSAAEALKRFNDIRGKDAPHEYIYSSCRIAVAHAGKDSKSDPDDADEIVRLHIAADIMKILARHFIEAEFKISDIPYSGD
jgi:hypothetical protein